MVSSAGKLTVWMKMNYQVEDLCLHYCIIIVFIGLYALGKCEVCELSFVHLICIPMLLSCTDFLLESRLYLLILETGCTYYLRRGRQYFVMPEKSKMEFCIRNMGGFCIALGVDVFSLLLELKGNEKLGCITLRDSVAHLFC